MTDTLPRTIPSDPAEQERQMPEWVKAYGHRIYGKRWAISPGCPAWDHLLLAWEHMPEPVDPDEAAAEAVYQEWWKRPGSQHHELALAAIKRGRALERGEG